MRAIAAGLAVLALVGVAAAEDDEPEFSRPYWLDRSVIETIGRAQNETAPNRASFYVTFLETAREAQDASAAAADRARLAAAAMRRAGGSGLEIRSSVSIEPIYREYRDSEGVRQSSGRDDQIDNYAARVQLNVELSDIAKAENVRAAALAVGPESTGDLQYALHEGTAAQREVYEAAVEDAAARARAAAAAAGARLGPLLALQEGQGPCMGQWYGGQTGYGRAYAAAPAPPPPPPPQEISVTGARGRQLTLSAEDIARLQLPADPPRVTLSAYVCAVFAVGP